MLQHQIPQCHQPRARGGMGGPPVTLVGVPHQVLLGPLYWLLPCMPTKTWLLTGPDGMDLRNSQEGDWVPAIPELVAKPGWSLIAHGPLKKIQCSVPGCCQQASAEFSCPGCGRSPTRASHTAQQQGPRCGAQLEAAKSICRGEVSDPYLSSCCHAASCIKASADFQQSFAFNFITVVGHLGTSESTDTFTTLLSSAHGEDSTS